MFTIATERPEDTPHIEILLNESFGADRRNKTSYRYRDGVDAVPYLSLVARRKDQIVGTIRYWPIALSEYGFSPLPALLLGPLAVDRDCRGEGIGVALMHASLDMAAWAGHPLAILVGDIGYYGEAGFRPSSELGITMHDEQPHRLLAKWLRSSGHGSALGHVKPWRCVRRRRHGQPAQDWHLSRAA